MAIRMYIYNKIGYAYMQNQYKFEAKKEKNLEC